MALFSELRASTNVNTKKGFTLAELLIVVAIIGVLVAVSIPIFSTQLEKARENTDLANLRDAKAAAVAMYLDNNENEGLYYYDVDQGKLVESTENKDATDKSKWTSTNHADLDDLNAITGWGKNGSIDTGILEGYGKGRAKVGDGTMSFKMSTCTESDYMTDENVTEDTTETTTYDAYYTAADDVRDKVIYVLIEARDSETTAAGTKTAGTALDSDPAQDFISMKWVAAEKTA